MMKKLNAWWFPMILAAILGGISFWLDGASKITWEETALDPAIPQYEINGIRAHRFGTNGHITQALTANRAWQFPNRTDAYLANADITFTTQGQEYYRAAADEAHYLPDKNQIILKNNVVFDKPANVQSPATHIETDKLTIDTEKQTAQTDAVVRYRYGLSYGSAQGLLYRHSDGYLNLPSRIKAIIHDPRR